MQLTSLGTRGEITLRSRAHGRHSSLLLDALELRPFLRGTKVALTASDNARLSAWQREQLLLTWCEDRGPGRSSMQ